MKKILSIALVALLAAGTVFAGFSGNASVALGYNFEKGTYGFSNGTGFDFDLDFASTEADKIAEGDVHAGIKATMAIKLANVSDDAAWSFGHTNIDPVKDGYDGRIGLGFFLEVAEAYVGGENWKLSILGTQGAPDYAKSAVDTKKTEDRDVFGNWKGQKDTAVSYSVSSNKAAGVTAEYAGYKASFGFEGNTKDNATTGVKAYWNYNAFVETPVYDFDVVTLQVAAIASSKKNALADHDNNPETDDYYVPSKNYDAFGASAKVGFDADIVSGSVAADFGMKKTMVADAKWTPGFDIAANLAISPVALDVYYANEVETASKGSSKLSLVKTNVKNLLSAKVAVDLTAFDVPVAFSFTGKDLINTQNLSAEAKFTLDAFAIKVTGGYGIDSTKVSVGGEVSYTADAFTAKAGADYSIKTSDKTQALTASASVETSTLVPGATLKLAWADVNDSNGDGTMNLLDKHYGKVEASCKIAF